MILKRLKLQNFRQFKGIQQIEFASEIGENGKNVTVIFGDNGRGKTGIYRAVMFCLYGDYLISQDEETKREDIYLVNLAALEEESTENNPVETSVQLEFTHGPQSFIITRKIIGMMDGQKRREQPESVEMSIIEEDGNATILDNPINIDSVVNKILDKSVKEYFLFDNEKINRLTLASIHQRREVAKGIRNLLQIEALDKAIRVTGKLKTSINTELSKKSTGKFGQLVYQLNQVESNQIKLYEEIKNLKQELNSAEIQKSDLLKHLGQFKEIQHLVQQRKEADEQLVLNANKIIILHPEMKGYVGKAASILLFDVINEVYTDLDTKRKKGEIPPPMRKDLIDGLLENRRCICGRDVVPNTEPYKLIQQWKDKASDMELDNLALEIWRELNVILVERDPIIGQTEILLRTYADHKQNIRILQEKIEAIDKQIGSNERKDALELPNLIKLIEKKQIQIQASIEIKQNEHDKLVKEKELLENQKKQVEKEENIKNELTQRADLANGANSVLMQIYKEFVEEIKEKVAANANDYFGRLIDKIGRASLGKIVVKEDFSLEISDKWGKPFLANISAGQRQVMSISFIAALAKTASMGSKLEMPLFMDAPFSRLEYEHRRNIIRETPDLCAQWILLAIDTEFRKAEEAKLLKEGKRWGKFYNIQSVKPYISVIQEYDIDTAFTLLS